MTKTAILFDLDGVLIDSETEYTRFWGDTGRKYNLPDPNFAANIKGTTLTQILSFFDESDRDDVVKAIHDFEKHMEYPYFPGVEDFLHKLRDSGIPTAVVTSSDDVKMSYLFKVHPELQKLITCFITGSQVKKSKPDPEGYLTAANKLGVAPEDCFVFEDSIQGLNAGQSSGATVVGVVTTNPLAKVEPLSDIVIHSFTELTVDRLLAFRER